MDHDSKDATTLLIELDRGLQSPNVGEQCEAIVRFSRLLHRLPLPLLINSACLKLSEAYRCGTNFIRMQICEVFERNQNYLDKVYNVDDFYRSIFTVTTSNDPIARSITLLTLGNIAPVVSEVKSIHHCIINSFETKVEYELNAAITCAASYVKYSSEFACHIYPKVVSMIESEESTTDILIRALSVLDHGFYNANDALTVRSFLIDVMNRIKLRKVICVCLTLSTRIAFTSLSHIQSQIDILIKIFLDNSKIGIKLHALRNLKFLAERSPHIWQTSHLDPLVSHLEQTVKDGSHDDQISHLTLSIFCKLLSCKCNFISQPEKDRIFKQCHILALDKNNVPLCSIAFELLTIMFEEYSYSIANNMIGHQLPNNLVTDISTAIKSFLKEIPATPVKTTRYGKKNVQNNPPVTKTTSVKTPQPSSKAIYRHIVRLCRLNPQFCPDLLKLLVTRISSKDTSLEDLSPYVTELMCAITQSTHELNVNPDIYWEIIKTSYSEMSETNLLNIVVLYFQTSRLKSSQIVEDLVDKVTPNRSLWFGFKVMRQAMRYGHHKIAKLVCDEIHERVTTDITDFYFKGLGKICLAESFLARNQNIDNNLNIIIPMYEESVSLLRASAGNSQTTYFQLQFLCLRIKYLQLHRSLRQICKVYQASPITYATLLNAIGATRGGIDLGLSKLGVMHQMPKIAKDFRFLAEGYENLALVSFNCDNASLDYVHLLKYSCIIMADAIDAIFLHGKNLPIINKLSIQRTGRNSELEHRAFEKTCIKLIELIRCEIVEPGISPSSAMIDPLIKLIERLSDELIQSPFIYPRYFFQALQKTQIKLAISPQPTTTPISVTINHNFVLKVEGIIQDSSKPYAIVRKISKIIVSLHMNSAKTNEPNVFFQSLSAPINNYFATEFLLSMKWSGLFNVEINISIIDDQDCLWKNILKERLNLNVS